MSKQGQWWRVTVATALACSAFAVGGCGDVEGQSEPDSEPKPKPASSPQQFADRFAPISGQRLKPVDDTFGTIFEEPEEPSRSVRYGGYSLTWTQDDRIRETVLGRGVKPDADGIYWSRVGDGWSASKPFGPRLVLDWVGPETKRTTPEFDRIERAVRAAYLGDTGVLEPAERPCADGDLDPLRGKEGECSVEGIPVSFADARKPLTTEVVEVEVLGVDTTDEVGEEPVTPARAEGRFVQVAYRLRNRSDRPITSLTMLARLDGETVSEAAGPGVLLPRSRSFPIPPGAELETSVVFDVDPEVAEQARAEGALVFATGFDDAGSLSPDLTQGWIRLAKAPTRLPEPPEQPLPPGVPPPQPEPTGPPDIDVDTGSGKPIGGSARAVFTLNTYFPAPKDFQRGGVRVGTRAGGCVVPPLTRRIKAGILAAERRETPGGGFGTPLDQEVLIADCGAAGTWAIASWRRRRPEKIFGNEFQLRGGRWVDSPGEAPPGCAIPDAAAAAWQIDISICDTPIAKRSSGG